jgi:hypothetical protein
MHSSNLLMSSQQQNTQSLLDGKPPLFAITAITEAAHLRQ